MENIVIPAAENATPTNSPNVEQNATKDEQNTAKASDKEAKPSTEKPKTKEVKPTNWTKKAMTVSLPDPYLEEIMSLAPSNVLNITQFVKWIIGAYKQLLEQKPSNNEALKGYTDLLEQKEIEIKKLKEIEQNNLQTITSLQAKPTPPTNKTETKPTPKQEKPQTEAVKSNDFMSYLGF